jgi:hypothetical protein
MFIMFFDLTARATGLVDEMLNERSDKQHSECTKRKKLFNMLVKLANAIGKAGASKVPCHIITILGDVIKARKRCATWFIAHQAESEAIRSHNEGHRYIIEALEEVVQVLSPLQDLEVGGPALDEGLFLYQCLSHFNILDGVMHGHVIQDNEEFKWQDETASCAPHESREEVPNMGGLCVPAHD